MHLLRILLAMSGSPQLHFLRAAQPIELAQKLNLCLFFRRHGGSAIGNLESQRVECSFTGSPTHKQILQAASMYFRKWQDTDAAHAYTEHRVVQHPVAEPVAVTAALPQEAQPMALGAAPPALGEVHAVALRSSLPEIKRLAQGLSAAECRNLAVYFALLGAPIAQTCGQVPALLMAKRAAAVAFGGRAKDWPELMEPHVRQAPPSPLSRCQCSCKCDSMTRTNNALAVDAQSLSVCNAFRCPLLAATFAETR